MIEHFPLLCMPVVKRLEVMMFGLFQSKAQKKLNKLEQVMMTMDLAAERDALDVLHLSMQKQIQILNWLHSEGGLSEQDVQRFLQERGTIRSQKDPQFNEMLGEKAFQAEQMYGLVG